MVRARRFLRPGTTRLTFDAATRIAAPHSTLDARASDRVGTVRRRGWHKALALALCLAASALGGQAFAQANMGLTKSVTGNTDGDGNGQASFGDTLTYTVSASNTGTVPLTNVVVTDSLITPNTLTCPTVAVGASCDLVGTYAVTTTRSEE